MKRPTKDTPTLTPKKRCAIYTRKSTDEGLDQEYNSLEAQRDSALAFISSQRHEGWIANDDGYDDGGFSGGNTNRPALKRLLADVEDRRIDVVVVYKIDRLSRSLSDFAKMVDLFDARGVTFVSVTQQFNTTTSMGRLILNILLSFAQFEREVTGERIRDKIAASKAKGMWMGGTPPLGYDVRDRKLVVNEPEAVLVRDPDQGLRTRGCIARANAGNGPAFDRPAQGHRPLRQDPGLLRRSGTCRRDAPGTAESERRPGTGILINDAPLEPRKFYIDGGEVEVIGHLVYDLDPDGKKLQVVKYTEYSGRAVRTLYPTREDLQSAWANPDTRGEVLRALAERGISFEELASSSELPDADPFDLLCHLAWNAPLLTRCERAEKARRQAQDLFGQYGATAREVLGLLLDTYIEQGIIQFNTLSDLMKVQPFDRFGSPSEIASLHFGGVQGLKDAVSRLQTVLYQ